MPSLFTACGLGAFALVLFAEAGPTKNVEPKAMPSFDATRAETAASPVRPVPAVSQALGPISASGYVVARRKSTVGSEIMGKIVEVLVDEGSKVEKGQVIARLDDVLAKIDLDLARSRVVSSDAAADAIAADLADARRINDRISSLALRGATTDAELTRTKARVDVLTAQLAQMHAAAAAARLDAERSAALLEKCTIKSPVAGVVLDRSAEPGEVISPMSAGGFTRTGIATIADRTSIELEIDVNESYIKRIKVGERAAATFDALPSVTLAAHVKSISPAASREKGTVKVRLVLDETEPRVLPDMSVSVVFNDEEAVAATENVR